MVSPYAVSRSNAFVQTHRSKDVAGASKRHLGFSECGNIYCNDTYVKILSWHARWIYLLLSNCTDIKFKFARVCSSLAF